MHEDVHGLTIDGDRIIVEGRVIGYYNREPEDLPSVTTSGGARFMYRSGIGVSMIPAPSEVEALRLLVHYTSSLHTPKMAKIAVSTARSLSAATGYSVLPIALSIYSLALAPSIGMGQLTLDSVMGDPGSPIAYTPAASIARLLEKRRRGAASRMVEAASRIRRIAPVTASRLLGYILSMTRDGPSYPVCLLANILLSDTVSSIKVEGAPHWLPSYTEALHTRGVNSIRVRHSDTLSLLSLDVLNEVLMPKPAPGRDGSEPGIRFYRRRELIKLIGRGVDPLAGYKVLIAGEYVALSPSDDTIIYTVNPPVNTFRALQKAYTLKPCTPGTKRLDNILKKPPCK
ncbi:MAG: hypothetical protein GSR86_07630 [Desulfurococcales archaeon]|nr:hypothetical protein [Desulfurococcales archaeon]